MTLQQWKDEAAWRFRGQFVAKHDGRIRHRTETDGNGSSCCPVIVFALDYGDIASP